MFNIYKKMLHYIRNMYNMFEIIGHLFEKTKNKENG